MTENIDCQSLLLAVVQAQDAPGAQQALIKAGFISVDLPSVGGFLGRRNVTLMIGVDAEKKDKAIKCLIQTCKERVEFIAVPLESAPLPLPTPTPVQIGGATVFEIPTERCEEL
jgi:uncharacterized protein YaaQ